jgi:hypothetical protein
MSVHSFSILLIAIGIASDNLLFALVDVTGLVIYFLIAAIILKELIYNHERDCSYLTWPLGY